MPLVGFLDKDGNKVSFNEALSGESTLAYTRDILHKIVSGVQRSNYGDSSVSVTSLLSCLRKTFLERTIPYHATPENLWYSLRGTEFHSLLDPGMDMPGWLSEKRFYKSLSAPLNDCVHCSGMGWAYNKGLGRRDPCGCHAVSGQIDGFDVFIKELLDKKSIGDRGLVYLKDGAKEPHVLQTNIYKWLMDGGMIYKPSVAEKKLIKQAGGSIKKIVQAGIKDWWQVTIPVKSIRIQYFSMMDVVLTGGELHIKTQFQYAAPPTHNNEARREVVRSYLEGDREKKMWRLTYNVPSVEILPTDQVVSYVDAKRQDLVTALQKKVMPPMCGEDERQWLCGFCGCKEQCDAYNKLQVESAPEQKVA